MCLSTVYRNSKAKENVCAKYVPKIDVDGNKLTFTDVLGEVIQVEGKLVSADLTAGVVVFAAA